MLFGLLETRRRKQMSTPLLHHVDETRLKALQQRLEPNGRVSADFLVLLAGSTMIATLGLFQNSPAVIIGAMIIAPLMRPLVCMSLATITADTKQILTAIITLITGTMVGIGISTTMALFLRAIELTPEILGRTHPTLLDLVVALAAGAVGAYCQTREELSETLAGVAISVALVPPLSVVGIGLAFGNFSVSAGAALLYSTNLVGITIAGALVFLVQGYSPLNLARRGLAVSGGCIALLAIPLGLSMRELILENQISSRIGTILREKTITFKQAQLRDVKVLRFKAPMSVQATIIGSEPPITPRQVKLVQDLLETEIGTALEFRLLIIPATEVTALEVSSSGEQKVINPPKEQGLNQTLQISPLSQPPKEAGGNSLESSASQESPPNSIEQTGPNPAGEDQKESMPQEVESAK